MCYTEQHLIAFNRTYSFMFRAQTDLFIGFANFAMQDSFTRSCPSVTMI